MKDMNSGLGKPKTNPDRSENTDIFGKTGNGTLDFGVSKNSEWENDPSYRNLNVSIWEADMDAIYSSALRSAGQQPLKSTEYSWTIFEENRKLFESQFPEYPVLGRYYDMYQDHVFDPDTVTQLLAESKALQLIELTEEADLALRKLIYGCETAVNEYSYLIFVCD